MTNEAGTDRGRFEDLVQAALSAPFHGWDFAWLEDQTLGEELLWDYAALAKVALDRATRVLDVDTGGGELLASLAPLPNAVATEAYGPNVATAKARLEPMGVQVCVARASALPLAGGAVDLVLNRHGALDAAEVARVLAPGGEFLTQQVGSRNDIAFNDALGVEPTTDPDSHTLESSVAAVRAAGLTVHSAQEHFPVTRYLNIGAVVFQLRAVPWQVPGFDAVAFDSRLRDIDEHIRRVGGFDVKNHRFLICGRKPREN